MKALKLKGIELLFHLQFEVIEGDSVGNFGDSKRMCVEGLHGWVLMGLCPLREYLQVV